MASSQNGNDVFAHSDSGDESFPNGQSHEYMNVPDDELPSLTRASAPSAEVCGNGVVP
jgi:hypothetical protein